jgi:hypothetical protein
MPSIRRTIRRPRGDGGGASASLYAQCLKCGATGTAIRTKYGNYTTYLATEEGRHKGCGGNFKVFKLSEERE